MEKQREKEQQKQQMRAELVQNLKSKLADLETLLTTHFGEPKGEKAASLIEKISSLTDENTEALSQLLGQVVAVLPAPETQTSDSTVISSNQTSNDTGLSSASSNQGQSNASTSTSNMPEGYEEAPPSQQFFINFVIQTKKKITEDMTSAEQKFEWIDASNALCKTEFLAGFPKMENWIGYVDSVSVADNGDVAIDIDIDNNKNEAQTLKIDPKFNRFVAGLEVGSMWGKKGTKVRFSGFFKEGKRSENECLATFGFDSEPKLVNNGFRFDFTDIRKF